MTCVVLSVVFHGIPGVKSLVEVNGIVGLHVAVVNSSSDRGKGTVTGSDRGTDHDRGRGIDRDRNRGNHKNDVDRMRNRGRAGSGARIGGWGRDRDRGMTKDMEQGN